MLNLLFLLVTKSNTTTGTEEWQQQSRYKGKSVAIHGTKSKKIGIQNE